MDIVWWYILTFIGLFIAILVAMLRRAVWLILKSIVMRRPIKFGYRDVTGRIHTRCPNCRTPIQFPVGESDTSSFECTACGLTGELRFDVGPDPDSG